MSDKLIYVGVFLISRVIFNIYCFHLFSLSFHLKKITPIILLPNIIFNLRAMINETEYQTILKYNYISQQITKYFGVLLYILCLFGTIMNILIFMQRAYQGRACSLYLLIASMCDFIHLNFGSLSNILQYGFHYDWTINSIHYCKIKSYISYVFTIISATIIILASIDRYILSSRKVHRWKFSSQSVAKRLIFFTIIFWLIISIPIAFCFNRIYHSSHNEQLICSVQIQYTSCFLVQSFYICILNGFIPPIGMIYFGCLTYINARKLRRRSLKNSVLIKRINYQLTSMLVLQSIKSSFVSLPFAIFNSYLLITIYTKKSALYQAKENVIYQIVYLLFWSNYTSFFVYFYSSDIFRLQIFTMIKNVFWYKQKHSNQQTELKYLTTTTNILYGKYKTSDML